MEGRPGDVPGETSAQSLLIPKRGHRNEEGRGYLAGPEFFLSDTSEIGARKRAICERRRLIGVFPGYKEEGRDPAQPPSEQELAISRAMKHTMGAATS